jgi:glycosyltransferase involved in cell wall biosynthesis
MKIVQVMCAFHLGGSEQVAVNIAVGLAKKGHECCVVTVVKPDSYSEVGEELKARLRKHDVKLLEFGGSNIRLNSLYCPFQLFNFFRKWQPDIIHSHVDGPDLMVSLTARLTSFKIVRTIHNVMLWESHYIMGWICETGFYNDLIVASGEGAREAHVKLRRRYRLPVSRKQIKIYNGIPLPGEHTTFNNPDLIEQIRSDRRKTKFCFAGRFTYQKGFDILLDALEKIPEPYRERFVIHAFGQGEDREYFNRRIQEKCLPVILHPPVTSIREIFPEFGAVIIPSRFEGFPLVSLEALAHGVPVIGTSVLGLNETYPPEWPLIVPVEDPDALSRIIMEFTDCSFDLKQLQESAKTWGEQFTISRMVDSYEKAYQDHLNS